MMLPHKVCPRCGQPAVLEMPRCRRCGHAYPAAGVEPTMTFARPLSEASRRELERARVPKRRSPAPLIATVLALLALGATAWLMRSVKPAAAPLASRTGPPTAAPPMRDPMAGMFVEREGRTEMPTLTVTNDDTDAMNLLLKDETGRVLLLPVPALSTASKQIPAGRYDIAVTSDNPAIRPNYGDAVFRRHKEYSTTFIQSPDYGPIHLGD
jgi:hypothetical protein